MWRRCLLLLLALAVSALGATNTIEVFNFDFGVAATLTHVDPTIHPGDTVRWIWVSGLHSVTAAGGQLESWDSGVHLPPFTNTHTFTELGTFNYFCSVHGSGDGCGHVASMSGKVIVTLPNTPAYRVTTIQREGNDIRVSWITGGSCKTNVLQRAILGPDASYTNNFADIFTITNTTGNLTNYLDVGAATNFPARYYRVMIID
jgi:plastocyanin